MGKPQASQSEMKDRVAHTAHTIRVGNEPESAGTEKNREAVKNDGKTAAKIGNKWESRGKEWCPGQELNLWPAV